MINIFIHETEMQYMGVTKRMKPQNFQYNVSKQRAEILVVLHFWIWQSAG